MPARRTSVRRFTVVDDGTRAETEAKLAGNGLDWADEPAGLVGAALAEWQRLAVVFERYPTRFREGDRQALVAYCRLLARLEAVDAAIDVEGVLVPGRGHDDAGRLVKNPLLATSNQTQLALRLWARELGLTPDSRGRANLDEKPSEEAGDGSNPFA